MIQIECPTRTLENDCAKLTSKVRCGNSSHNLYYSIPVQYADWFADDRCDGFLVGLVFQAMQMKKNVRVEGPLSSRLFHSLQNFFIPMMSKAFPNLHQINVEPTSLVESRSTATGVATGFSGGIDSFAALIQHFVQEKTASHKISHLLFHNVGSHGSGKAEDARKLFWQRYETVKPFAHQIGIPFIPIDSNLPEIFPISFITMHSALNVSVILVLQNQFQRYYYASAYKYADCGVDRTDDIGRFDPLAIHLFSTEGLDCVSSGCQMSRVEKTELVANYEPSYRQLNVCVDPTFEGRNCSVCFKCRRTLTTLEILGLADAYQDVFDLSKFRSIGKRYLLNCLRYKKGSYEAEIADLFLEKGAGPTVYAFRLRRIIDRLIER